MTTASVLGGNKDCQEGKAHCVILLTYYSGQCIFFFPQQYSKVER